MLRAPFPYFGSKSAIASKVWEALGQPAHYLEPFFGSGAVLLARPAYDASKHVETVCDADGLLCNVWRALQLAPDEVARWCDWPVNHADLQARRKRMMEAKMQLLEQLVSSDEYFDARLAGYWIWTASCWIGDGVAQPGEQMPHVSDSGHGVHALLRRDAINQWFAQLSARLRCVRVVCGDWSRVCGGNWQTNCGTCGIFFDPPYGAKAKRCARIYDVDSDTVADDVRNWCRKRAGNKKLRIVLAGYVEEHEELLAEDWTMHQWTAHGGYSHLGHGRGRSNRKREALFFSPHCLSDRPLLVLIERNTT